MAERNKTMYGKVIEPDVNETNQEIYLQKALDWLWQWLPSIVFNITLNYQWNDFYSFAFS